MDAKIKIESNKRIRSTNWSEQEKKVLRMLVLERADIIEKKDTSTNTNTAKKIAWEELLSRFNAVNTNKRDMTQLLNQWRNMKNKAKKSEFAYRRARTTTGGGPPPPSPPPEDRELMEAIPQEFTVDSNCFDSDTMYIIQQESTEIATQPPVSLPHKKLEPDNSQASRGSPSPVQQTSQSIHEGHGTTRSVDKTAKSKRYQSDCCTTSHEHQLFVLAKTAREKAMLYDKEAHECKMMNERELHERRMTLMALEEEYLKTKIRNLK